MENDLKLLSSKKQMDALSNLGQELSKERLIWLSGYFAGQAELNNTLAELFQNLGKNGTQTSSEPLANPVQDLPVYKQVETKQITIMYGSQSGNCASFSKLAKEIAEKKHYQVKLVDMADYKLRDLKSEKNLLIIVSTYGEGDPPFSAEELYEYIHSERAPELPDLNYSVLALGDKSYFHFCKTGIDFDKRLEELGAKRISKRVDCDLSYKNEAGSWLNETLQTLDNIYSGQEAQPSIENNPLKNLVLAVNKEFPYYAEIQNKIRLNGRGSEKETYHIELLIDSSKIKYKPGDSVAVKAANSDDMVKKILEACVFTGNEKVLTKNGNQNLKDSLKNDFELTNLNVETIKKHQEKAKDEALAKILENKAILKEYTENNDVLDLLHQFPVEYNPNEFVKILRPLGIRYYSIASSQKTYEDELHITVEAVRTVSGERIKNGCCSTFFADYLNVGDKVAIYIKPNEGFRLPLNQSTPIIMIGAGTGIAPFRAFVNERAQSGATGKNWLIFGSQRFRSDYLYQTEWLKHLKSGTLHKLNLAFSRDQEEKIYVQHKILQNSKEIYEWLKSNAYVYVCGDKKKLASSVYNAFVNVLQKEASLSENEAEAWMKDFRRKGLYREDVY